MTDTWGEMITRLFYASGADAAFFAGMDAARRGDNETSRRLLAESERILTEYSEVQNVTQ